MRTIATITSVAAGVLALAAAGCDLSTTPGSTTTPPAPTTGTPGSGSVQQWVMPDLTGSVLQDAQDKIQSLTGNPAFFTSSHDLSGQGRHQVVDENWKVCTQNIPAGSAVTITSKIDFGVVKLDETCP